MASSSTSAKPLDIPLHIQYIQNLDKRKDLSYHLTEHLRLNGIYWGLTALCIMGRPDALDRDEVIEYVMSCWDDAAGQFDLPSLHSPARIDVCASCLGGAFGAHPAHDGHIHPTLSAIQILVIYDALHRLDLDRTVSFLLDRVSADGSVSGDSFGESDTRFSHILLLALSLLGRLDSLDELHGGAGRERVCENVRRSMNFDGAFGAEPGAESHGAQVWVCVGALAILGRLDLVDRDLLGSWLSERQLPNGGLNGRPEKLEDVCYSWWNLAALSILERSHWINRDNLIKFILSAQDLEDGGIADRPGDWVDVFHTIFGVAGLSLLGYPGLVDVDPIYCMPAETIEKLGLRKPYRALQRMTEYPSR